GVKGYFQNDLYIIKGNASTKIKQNCEYYTPNARLRGWQRTTTKLKHNNRNHRDSLGLETPRVDSPS
ncbi:hypothetical protein, partial [Vibrio cholerae]|uniref:hypothetical protein n=1 Tax=Vibrio cholerae TaxID=666 RepID=UPI003D2F9CC2